MGETDTTPPMGKTDTASPLDNMHISAALLALLFLCGVQSGVIVEECGEVMAPCNGETDAACCPGSLCSFVAAGYYACVDEGDPSQECQLNGQICDGNYPPCCEGQVCDCYGVCKDA